MFPPSIALKQFVQCFWVVECNLVEPIKGADYLYANGGMGISFNFEEAPLVNGETVSGRSLFDGTNHSAKIFQAKGKLSTLGVRFHPGGAYPVTGIPLHQLAQHPIALDELDMDSDDRLYQQMRKAADWQQRIAMLENWLLQRIDIHRPVSRLVQQTMRLQQGEHGRLSIDQLAWAGHSSRRTLERRFAAEVGISPKWFAQLLRVEYVRMQLKYRPHRELADISELAGYYDQSHFNREFRRLIGITPASYRTRKLAENK